MPILARSRSLESTSGSQSTTRLFAGVMARVQPHLSFLPRQWQAALQPARHIGLMRRAHQLDLRVAAARALPRAPMLRSEAKALMQGALPSRDQQMIRDTEISCVSVFSHFRVPDTSVSDTYRECVLYVSVVYQ